MFEIFQDGNSVRGITTSSSSQSGTTAGGTSLPLSNANNIVAFEVGMTLVASTSAGGAPSSDTVTITAVNRSTGVVTGTASASTLSSNWAIGSGAAYLSVQGDVPSGGISQISNSLALCGLLAWVPKTAPSASENFWGVDRSADPTRLGGLRYDASSYTIEEGITNALAFTNREGAKPDLCIMDFASYAALVNQLGAKVNYVQIDHDEVEVSFEGITFQSAYGRVTVLADRSCPPQTAFLLTMSTWKMRSLGKVPKIFEYGMEGLQGLRVYNADALEVRIGYYGQLICSAPGWNCVVTLSA